MSKEKLKDLEDQLYHSNFRIRKYKQEQEFDAVEREEFEKMAIERQIKELKEKI